MVFDGISNTTTCSFHGFSSFLLATKYALLPKNALGNNCHSSTMQWFLMSANKKREDQTYTMQMSFQPQKIKR